MCQDRYVRERREWQREKWSESDSSVKDEPGSKSNYFHGAMWLVDVRKCHGITIGRDVNCFITLNVSWLQESNAAPRDICTSLNCAVEPRGD